MAGKKRQIDDRLALGLARGLSVTAAASECGVSVRTAERRMHEPGFPGRVQALRSELLASAFGKLAGGADAAIDCLTELLKSESHAIRLGAARGILENLLKLRADCEFDMRLSRLEESTKHDRH